MHLRIFITTAAILGLAMAGGGAIAAAATDDESGQNSTKAQDSALEQQCRTAQRAASAACPCTINAGRELGLSDDEIRAILFASGPQAANVSAIAPMQRGRLRRAQYECIQHARQARPLGEAEGAMLNQPPEPAERPAPPYIGRPSAGRPLPADDYIGQVRGQVDGLGSNSSSGSGRDENQTAPSTQPPDGRHADAPENDAPCSEC